MRLHLNQLATPPIIQAPGFDICRVTYYGAELFGLAFAGAGAGWSKPLDNTFSQVLSAQKNRLLH